LWLDDVQTLLAKAGTAPLDFTLHDDEHSYRVAQRMAQLIPEETLPKLSDFELALLLQSAYLHDIGMNPRRKIVRQIRDYLFSGTIGDLDQGEAQELQRWLDDDHPGVQPPVLPGGSDSDRLCQAELITGYFCRHRHNEWTELFVLATAPQFSNPPYATWVQDLILLCKSHHYELPRLMEAEFDFRFAGPGRKHLNLRYLAAVLRVADILEFDPERTPPIVFRHRSPDKQSEIFWYKDHDIGIAIEKGTWTLILTARTASARTHRAVLETATQIDVELETCAAIERQSGFLRGMRPEQATHYVWPWPQRLARDVRPLPHTFEYIEGAFRPSPERLISLLAGTRLYHSKLAAVRELLQNAFDAVKEQIALELLEEENPSDQAIRDARSSLQQVTLSLKTFEGSLWLICSDTGVGMTKRVIENYVLISGSPPRPEVLELQRVCLAKNVPFERSGEFGIGVLSYFMLADKMVIETRSSPDRYRDQELFGWRFEMDGIDDFGELRVHPRIHRGTMVKLRLRPEINDLVSGDQLINHIQNIITKIPCKFIIELLNQKKQFPTGWIRKPADFLSGALNNFRYSDYGDSRLKSAATKTAEEARRRRLAKFENDASKKMRFFGPSFGSLPNGSGSFRVILPYFELREGASPVFIDESNDTIRSLALYEHSEEQDFVSEASEEIILSWRGFVVSSEDKRVYIRMRSAVSMIVEIDAVSDAAISVDRYSLELPQTEQIEAVIEEAASALYRGFCRQHCRSVYWPLFPRCSVVTDGRNRQQWFFDSARGGGRLTWRTIRFPAVVVHKPQHGVKFARIGDCVAPVSDFRRTGAFAWPLEYCAADRIVFMPQRSGEEERIWIGVVYTEGESVSRDDRVLAKFPQEWGEVLATHQESRPIFNINHRIVQAVDTASWQEFRARTEKMGWPEMLQKVAVLNPQMASAFLMSTVLAQDEILNALCEQYSEDYVRAFELGGSVKAPQSFLIFNESWWRVVSRTGADTKYGVLELPQSGHWWLKEISHEKG
jgi:hypothetical protein